MMTVEDAQRAVKLASERKALHARVHAILIAPEIGVCDMTERWQGARLERGPAFRVMHLRDELCDLLRREFDLQAGEMGKEMEGLGVAPSTLVDPKASSEPPGVPHGNDHIVLPKPISGHPRRPL